jgi:hypothetical protein
MSQTPERRPEQFPTTRWSQVNRAGGQDAAQASQALGSLLQNYLPALRAHLVQLKQIDEHPADDILQAFVATKFLEHNLPAHADRARGRFRTLVLTALDRFIVSERRWNSARKRSADQASLLDNESLEALVPVDRDRSADPYDVEWARVLLLRTAKQMEDECRSSGRQDIWGVFRARVLCPAVEGADPVDYAQLADEFGLRSPSQATNILITAKRMFQRILRSIVGEYACSPEDIEEEIQDLFRALSGPAGE